LKGHEYPNYPKYQYWLGGVFVPEHKRGLGYSSTLLSHTLSYTQSLDIPSVYLQCESHNIALYLKYGFEVIHKVFYQNVEKAIMEKRFKVS